MNKIAMTGQGQANAWKAKCEDLNQQTETAVREMGELLDSVRQFCKGNLSDELVALGNVVMGKAQQLMQAMQMILDVINSLLSMLGDLISQGMEFIGNIGKVMGG